jgi:simple sugar transport system ATP-binding protein
MDTILKGISLNKYFGPIRALSDVNLSIFKGEVVALIGDNGAGKSTLIKILAGVHRPDSGVLQINDQEINLRCYTVRKARRLGIETVYQERSLGEKQPLWRNLFVGRHLRNRLGFIRVREEKKLTLAMLQNSIGLKGVGISPDARADTLSGGERQGLAISRAMHFNAALTILDEPTTALSVKEVTRVLAYIRSIADQGNSALLVSHNMHHIHQVANRFLFLSRGTIVHECQRDEMSVTQLIEMLETLSMTPAPDPKENSK